VYPSIVHCWPEVPPPRSRVMLGMATLTMEMSSVIRKNPSDPIVRTVRACGASAAGAAVSATGTGGLELDKVGLPPGMRPGNPVAHPRREGAFIGGTISTPLAPGR
jgi:hypothetical protein